MYFYLGVQDYEGSAKAPDLLLRKELCNEATGAPLTFVLSSLGSQCA